jgi:hypothetical protein
MRPRKELLDLISRCFLQINWHSMQSFIIEEEVTWIGVYHEATLVVLFSFDLLDGNGYEPSANSNGESH